MRGGEEEEAYVFNLILDSFTNCLANKSTHINYISNEKYLQMHLFSQQNIAQACKANIYDLITVDSTILTEYLSLEEQWCHIMFLLIQAAQDTEWPGLVVGGGPQD